MLRPVIMIGCGGSGSKAVRYVRDAVQRRLRHAGWIEDMPEAWSFIGVDTLTSQEDPTEIPTMPARDFLSVSAGFVDYDALHGAVLAKHPPSGSSYRHLAGWLPCPDQVKVPLQSGAGQLRAVGRTACLLALEDALKARVAEAFNAAKGGGPELQSVSQCIGVPTEMGEATPEPVVVVCTSVAGGTGAGIALDVIDLVRRIDGSGSHPVLVLFPADIFDWKNPSMAANSLGLLAETMAAYWSDGSESILPSAVAKPGVGPHSIFVVGRHGLNGGDLGDTASVYRAAGEALSTWVTEPKVQENVHNFVTVNWYDASKRNFGGYPFGENHQRGAISSFGAATVTVGRDRFERWACDLLAREVLESLVHGHRTAPQATAPGNELTEKEVVGVLADEYALTVYEARRGDGNPAGVSTSHARFAADDLVWAEMNTISDELRRPFSVSHSGVAGQWRGWIESQVRACRGAVEQRAAQFDVSGWGGDMLAATCRAISEVVSATSLEVAAEATRRAVARAESDAGEIRRRAEEDRAVAGQDYQSALQELSAQKGALTLESPSLAEAFSLVARAMARSWRSRRRMRVAEITEAAAHQVLSTAQSVLQAAREQAAGALEEDAVKAWPRRQQVGIPSAYLPTSVELPLESHEAWVGLLDDLCKESQVAGRPAGGPVDATRRLIVAGDESDVAPILAAEGIQGWEPGAVAQLRCDATTSEVERRVRDWTSLPGSRFARVVSEGLGSYLADKDLQTGAVRVDHGARLQIFRQRLEEADTRSEPLIQIDMPVYGKVHKKQPSTEKWCAAFPFPEGHPAADIARKVIGEDNFKHRTGDTSSVLVSSFIARPMHPITVRSLTGPPLEALGEIGERPKQIQGTFWLWRRARNLKEFVPVPTELRHALIRGFAVARLCGYITADPSQHIRVSAAADVFEFRRPLLSSVEADDVLGALLEAFALSLATVGTEELAAFEHYRRLYDLGNPIVRQADLLTLFSEGSPPHPIVDQPKAVGSNHAERRAAALGYLDDNLERFDGLLRRGYDGSEYRRASGQAARDVPTLEIADESAHCYRQVREHIDVSMSRNVV